VTKFVGVYGLRFCINFSSFLTANYTIFMFLVLMSSQIFVYVFNFLFS
jgi:hypothetical protein